MTVLRRITRRTACCAVPHGVHPELVITLYPGGVIGLREKRRRREVQIGIGALYARLLAAEVKQSRAKKGEKI